MHVRRRVSSFVMATRYSRVATALERADRVLVLTGAGVSAASGIPTFRGADGLWRHYRAEELATLKAFHRHPALVWEWYQWRLNLVLKNAPNAAHTALARLGERFEEFWIVTQNVDGYHQQAGSQRLIELHGSLRRSRCIECGSRQATPVTVTVPHCECGGMLRPDVVWFGETLPLVELQQAFELARKCKLFITAGTSSLVEPAASLLSIAATAGALTVEVNPTATVVSRQVDVVLQEEAAQAFPGIWSICEKKI